MVEKLTASNTSYDSGLKKAQEKLLIHSLETLAGDAALAFLDLRTRQQHVKSHPIFSVNVPIDQFESLLAKVLGNLRPQTVLICDDIILLEWAKRYMLDLNFPEPIVVPGGFKNWCSQGLPYWGGEYTASKAFGEWVEKTGEIDLITPQSAMWQSADLQLDVRPEEEFRKFSLPQSMHCPTGRIGAIKTSANLIYMHCAGRTRGIIAAQTWKDLDRPERSRFIAGGTQGWELAGGIRSFDNEVKPIAFLTHEEEQTLAESLLTRLSIPICTKNSLPAWQVSHQSAFHIRVMECSRDGHTISPTTIIQSTDQFLAAHHISILIHGPKPLDVAVATTWLRRLGWDAYPLLDDLGIPESLAKKITRTTANVPKAVKLVDTRPSQQYSESRVQGSVWSQRSELQNLNKQTAIFLIDANTAILHGTINLAKLVGLNVLGGVSWDQLDPSIIDNSTVVFDVTPTDQPIFFPNRHKGNLKDAQGYLDWEHSLLPALERFGPIPWAPINRQSPRPKSHLGIFYRQVRTQWTP
jgi:rhodanese-related sulfurtransferase